MSPCFLLDLPAKQISVVSRHTYPASQLDLTISRRSFQVLLRHHFHNRFWRLCTQLSSFLAILDVLLAPFHRTLGLFAEYNGESVAQSDRCIDRV